MTSTLPRTEARSGTLGGERKGWVEQVALVAFIAVPFLAILAAIPVAWGGWLGWTDVLLVRSSSTPSPGTASRSASTATSPTARSRPSAPLRIALAVAGCLAIEGPVDPLGRRPPQAPQVLRQEGDPHSPWRYGETRAGADQGPLARAHGLAVRRRADPAAAVRPRPAQGPRHRPGQPRRSRCWSRRLAARCRPLLGGLITMVVAGRADRVLLGQPGPGRRCCTTSPGRSTRSATRSASGRSRPATGPATSGGWRSCRWASPGTTCTTPTRPAPGTACCAARSTPAPGDLAVREAAAGRTTCAGRRRSGSTPRRASLMTPARHDRTRDDRRPRAAPAPHAPTRPAPRVRMTGKERREQLLDIGRVAVRREGLRRHLGRGDRRQGRRLQAGRLRALRRQGGPVRGRRRPRDAAAARRDAPAR